MKFPERQLEKIVKQICQINKIQFKSLSEGFILQLTKNNKTEYIYGYNFPCNNVVSSKICDDKAGCSEILTKNKIACMEHVFFMDGFYKDEEVLAIFKKFKNDVVVKPNTGTGGRDVYHCQTKQELLNNIKKVLSHSINFTISPFYTYDTEYRLIMYKDKPHIIYAKQRTTE
jgi:carbamoylphosphate synthase large subunit